MLRVPQHDGESEGKACTFSNSHPEPVEGTEKYKRSAKQEKGKIPDIISFFRDDNQNIG